jgi:DDE family transposase
MPRFEHIHPQVTAWQAADQPVIAVATQKTELVGEFTNLGRELWSQGDPVRVRVHNCELPELGKVAPYGVYNQTQKMGVVHGGTEHDPAALAVASIRRWWNTTGQQVYPTAQRWLITVGSGCRHGDRTRLWKTARPKVANETGLEISVCHRSPGTSPWNTIAHRLFSSISQNWRGQPFVSHEVMVNLLAATTTGTGLTVRSDRDTHNYPKGLSLTDPELQQVHIIRDACHVA